MEVYFVKLKFGKWVVMLKWIVFVISLFLLFVCFLMVQNSKIINGKVILVEGELLIGVNVVIQGLSIGIIMDFDGGYSLNVMLDDVLIFFYIGFRMVEIEVGS